MSHLSYGRTGWGAQWLQALTQIDHDNRLPKGLQAALRPYQLRGFAWPARNARLGLGSVIADDMGLGKTLQVIALLLHLKARGELEAGRALVIVPTSLLSNWQKEVARFAPALSVEGNVGGSRNSCTAACRARGATDKSSAFRASPPSASSCCR